jgi:hypothetical protein
MRTSFLGKSPIWKWMGVAPADEALIRNMQKMVFTTIMKWDGAGTKREDTDSSRGGATITDTSPLLLATSGWKIQEASGPQQYCEIVMLSPRKLV